MISERTLRQWRRDALVKRPIPLDEGMVEHVSRENDTLRDRIIRLTQTLMDIHLIRKG